MADEDVPFHVQDPLLRAAYERAEQAYRLARPVYDRYPHGPPPRDELPHRDRALLDELDRADAAVKRLRAQARASRPMRTGG